MSSKRGSVVSIQADEPVTKKERWGFYMFNFANEPFYTSSMGLAIPVILETLAANAGYENDLVTKCNTTTAYSCKVKLVGTWYDTSAFTLYTTAVTTAIAALVFVSLSSLADYGNFRKVMLMTSSIVSAITLILFLTVVTDDLFWLAALLTIITNVAYGASNVFYYAFVPTLTRYSDEVIQAKSEKADDLFSIREKVANDLSGKSFAIGYTSGVLHLIISGALIYFSGDIGPVSTYSLQMVCAITGVWMLIFDIFTLIWLKNRPGLSLPKGESYLIFSWKQTIFTFTHIKSLSQIFIFLFSWFLISDALSTVITIAVLFAKKELGFKTLELLIAAIIVPLAAAIGCFFWNFIMRTFKLSTKSMVLLTCLLYLLQPIYGLIGLEPSLTFGLKSKLEAYIVMAYHGFLLGAIQSYYRVTFSEMLPAGKENEFFGLYAIVNKGSSWIGPLVVGVISDRTGSIRSGLFFILASMILGIIIVSFVNIDKASSQARAFEQAEKKALSRGLDTSDFN